MRNISNKNNPGDDQPIISSLERRQRILSSAPATFVFSSVLFGTINELFGSASLPQHPFSWTNFVFTGVIFGIFMTILMRYNLKKFNKLAGLSSPHQQWVLQNTARTGVLPNDPTVLKALPDYLDKRLAMNEKSRKPVTVAFTIISVLCGLIAIVGSEVFIALTSVGLISLAAMNYKRSKKLSTTIRNLQKQAKKRILAPQSA